MKTISEIKGATEILNKHIIWSVVNRSNWEKLFVGTKSECEVEFIESGYDPANEEIHQNKLRDQWENIVDGIGYVTFASGDEDDLEYPL